MSKTSIYITVFLMLLCGQIWAQPDIAPHWYQFDRQTDLDDIGIAGDDVLQTDSFCNVPSYINQKTIGSGYSGYYQCTEFVARYLSTVYNLDYKEQFNADAGDSQGFVGLNFSPRYHKLFSPKPYFVDSNWQIIKLKRIDTPIPGDIFIDKRGHSAIIKEVDIINKTITLIEQNYVTKIKGKSYYVLNRKLKFPQRKHFYFRFPIDKFERPISSSRISKIKELLFKYRNQKEELENGFRTKKLPSKLLNAISYLKTIKALNGQIEALETELAAASN